MDSLANSAARIFDIEARQDEALRALEALELQIERVLAEQLAAIATRWPTDAAVDNRVA